MAAKLRRWLTWDAAAIVSVVLYFYKGVERIASFGDQPLGHAAGDIETLTRDAARIFAEQGLAPTWGLPVYPGYPILSEIPKLRENFVYAHQFPGPEYALAFFYRVFGVSDGVFQWGRLFPLATSLAAVLIFAHHSARVLFGGSRKARAILLMLSLSLPVLGHWSLQWAGQSYATSFLFLLFALSLEGLQTASKCSRRLVGWAGFALGFATMYNHLPFAFVSIAMPLVAFQFLAPETRSFARLRSLTLLFGFGLTAAFTLRFFQLAGYLDSFALAWESQLQIAKLRATSDFGGADATRVMLIGQYSAHVGRFFPVNAIPMGLLGLFFAWLSRLPDRMRRDRMLAVGLAFASCYAWIFLMKNFSIHHTHLHPRVFLALYIPWILLIAELVRGALKAPERGRRAEITGTSVNNVA